MIYLKIEDDLFVRLKRALAREIVMNRQMIVKKICAYARNSHFELLPSEKWVELSVDANVGMNE